MKAAAATAKTMNARILLAIILVLCGATTAFSLDIDTIAPSNPLITQLKEIEKKYGIEVKIGPFKTSDFFKRKLGAKWNSTTAADKKRIMAFVAVFIREWNKYPVDFIGRSGLKSVALAKGLNYAGFTVGGLADLLGTTLVMNIDYADDDETEAYLLHHELFHYIDVARMGLDFSKDPEWKKLNPAKFSYLGSGVAMLRKTADLQALHPREGFITLYSTSAVEEDKAEVFAYIFSPSRAREAEKFCKEDALLRKKFDYMKNVYLRGLSAEFTDEFFLSINPRAR